MLASGSSGNCAVVRSSHGVMLIDAGLSPRATAKRLEGTGISIEQIDAICLTHLDGDHFQRGWQRIIRQNQIRVFCAHRQRRFIVTHDSHELLNLVRGIDPQPFEPIPGVCVSAVDLRHDIEGSIGFVIESAGVKLCYATDLGRAPTSLVDAFTGADLLAIESNYDPAMQLQSGRPAMLINRVMGGRGHLSNREAFEAVVRILDASHQRHCKLPSHVVLLHRSDECNCPKLLRRLFHRDSRLIDRLVLAEQHERTEWMSPTHRAPSLGEQMVLSFG